MDGVTSTTTQPAAYLEAQRDVAALAAEVRASAARLARAQWEVMDHATPGHRGAEVIDPEALVLLSLWLAPHDRALVRTLHAWVARWSDLLSVQRTRNIARIFPPEVLPALHALAQTAYQQGKDFRWAPILRGGAAASGPHDGDENGSTASVLAAPGARLASARSGLLVLRLRMAFGVGARADAVAFLLARGESWSTVTGIAHATGYTPSAIRRALDRMAEAKIVLMLDDGTTRYRCEQAPWAALLALPHAVTPWRYWLQRFVFATAFATWAAGVTQRKLTAYAIAEQCRQLARGVHVTDDPEAQRAWKQAFADGSTLGEMMSAVRGVTDLLRLA